MLLKECYTSATAFAQAPPRYRKCLSGPRFFPPTDGLARIICFSGCWLLCC